MVEEEYPEEPEAYDLEDDEARQEVVDEDEMEPEEAGFMMGYEKAGDEGFEEKKRKKEEEE